MSAVFDHAMARLRPGGSGSSAASGLWGARHHLLVRLVACSTWLVALASLVTWATGYAVQL